MFYFSSIIEDDHRRKTDLKLEELNQKVKTKRITAQEAKRERLDILNISAEKLRVGFVYRKSSFKGTEMDVTCIKKRIISQSTPFHWVSLWPMFMHHMQGSHPKPRRISMTP